MKAIVYAIVVTSLACCAGVNWQNRTGTYSLDDAKREYGPPDNSDRLSSGESVCSWTTSVGRNWIDKLILTFDKEGKLVAGEEKRF